MNRTFKTLALACVTGLAMAGAAITPADARGGFGGGHFGGMGGGHFGGGGHGGAHFAGGYGGHHDHGFRHNRFFVGGLGYGYYDGDYYDYAYGDDDCGYARDMWHRTGTSYWRHRYYACVG